MGLFKKGNKAIALKRIKYDLGNETYINLRELTSQELIHFQKANENTEVKSDFVFDLIARCAVDDDGQPLFENADDVKNNFNVGLSALIEIEKTISDISGLAKKN